MRDWVQLRGVRYQIAHRGSGDVFPEHSMPAYQAAYDAGALCMEVSVDITADGVLVCLHDLAYDRTTTGHGAVSAQPSSVLDTIGIVQPQLGPYWLRAPLPRVPRLRDVLQKFGGRMVICLEAKNDAAFEPMMRLVDELRLRDSIVIKAYWRSNRIAPAQRAGYGVFSYLAPTDMTPGVIAKAASNLRPANDYLVLPATTGNELRYYPPELITGAVSTGVPVWAYPVHRRADAAYFFNLGVQGVVSSSYAYTTTDLATSTRDTWADKRISSGEMSRQPDRPSIAPHWSGTADLELAVPGTQQFLALGQLGPLRAAAQSYRVSFSTQWPVLPPDRTSNITLAFGAPDDAYYEHRLGQGNGYHAMIRPDGRLELYRHDAGNPEGDLLAKAQTAPVRAGEWLDLTLDVAPYEISWSRSGSATVRSADPRYRGGYLHIGRTADDARAVAAFRDFVVS